VEKSIEIVDHFPMGFPMGFQPTTQDPAGGGGAASATGDDPHPVSTSGAAEGEVPSGCCSEWTPKI